MCCQANYEQRTARKQKMSFSGFSEDDIRKLTKPQDLNKPQKGATRNSIKKVTFKSHSTTNASKTKHLINNTVNHNLQTSELPDEAKLNVPLNTKTDVVNVNNNSTTSSEATKLEAMKAGDTQQNGPAVKIEKKPIDLDEFEIRQKLIEEQNRKRKELLAKALADRTKQTQEEVQRLGEIQEEFKKLDAVLSSDVKILRKEIEAASIEYMECQKKYNRIEKEFLDAKLLLHQKLEKKDMLTEHLHTIIEKNEERKAEKLTELLQKLQVETPEIDKVAILNIVPSTDQKL